MRYLVIVCLVFVLAVEISFPVGASTAPEIDKIEAMLQKIEANLAQASAVISEAKVASAKAVEAKVQEKAQLKEAVVQAEAKVEKMAEVQAVYIEKMVAAGVDTTQGEQFKLGGAMYDAFLIYKKEGGTEEFDYFRMYIYK